MKGKSGKFRLLINNCNDQNRSLILPTVKKYGSRKQFVRKVMTDFATTKH